MEIIVGYCATCGSPVWADQENMYAPFEINCSCFTDGPILINPPDKKEILEEDS